MSLDILKINKCSKTLELLVTQEYAIYNISVSDHMACINKPSGESGNSGWYYMEQEMDWDYISMFADFEENK